MAEMTDRDHFAAAALTGLLAQGDDGSFSEESYARGAYRWADAMLRERERVEEPIQKEKLAEVSFELTDAERAAIEIAMHRCDTPEFKTLRGLLERMK